MHVIVLGSGVIGVTSAYYLANQGHQVTVLDGSQDPPSRPATPTLARSRPVTRPPGPRRGSPSRH